MKQIYPTMLKKLTLNDIKNMRQSFRCGHSKKRLAKKYNIHRTTVEWHLAELNRPAYIEVE